jgi:sugar lactone lactonase YvrE
MRGPRNPGRTASFVATVAVLLALIPVGSAHAQTSVDVLVAFDESAGELPEGIALDRTGNIYVSVAPLGELWRIPRGSDEPQPFGSVDGIVPGRDFGMLGLAVDVFGNVYAGVQSADPAANGVWRFDRWTGDAHKIPGSADIGIANGLAFDKQGTLYVGDSVGAIWRIPWGGSASLLLRDQALTGDGSLGVFIGANGVAVRRGVLIILNTERRTMLSLPRAGGELSVVTTFPEGDNPDGIALDVFGNVFVAINSQNTIARVTPGGDLETIASGDPLDFPSSIAFGTAGGERMTMFGVNFSISENLGLPPGDGPGVFELNAGVPGAPLP